jgi:aminoglycoside phosphotransferase (APT) family kinase protein
VREFVLRRPPYGHKARSAHDMLREARLLRALAPVFPRVPGVVAVCDDPAVLDADFYVMERVRGVILRTDLPPALGLDAPRTRRLCEDVLGALVDLHALDWRAAGLDWMDRGPGYTRRQIEGWTRRFRDARTPDVPDFESVMGFLAERTPEDAGTCLVHNDFRFDNVVLDPARDLSVVGVLDWELAAVGDPLMDLGNSLAYWVRDDDEPGFRAMRRQPTHAPGMLDREGVVAFYAERTGRALTLETFAFYELYGLFRLAGILQQIYRRFVAGDAQNPQFAMFGPLVGVLEARCRRIIAQEKS